jgi:hypothetical protein
MHYKQNNKESKSYVQGLRPFGNTLPRGIKGILKKNGYNYSEIISKWSLLVGKNISIYCYPESIKMKQMDSIGTLILMVERGNEINIEYSKREIINKINSYFGYKLINEIRLKTFNLKKKKKEGTKNALSKTSKKLKDNINKITNKDIRDSLSELLDLAKK